jgi:hypothetical protein
LPKAEANNRPSGENSESATLNEARCNCIAPDATTTHQRRGCPKELKSATGRSCCLSSKEIETRCWTR